MLLTHWYRPNTGSPLLHGDPQWLAIEDRKEGIDYATCTPIYRPEKVVDSSLIDLLQYSPSTYKDVDGKLLAFTYGGTRRNAKQNPINRWLDIATPDFCRLLGYYVAEGSCGKHSIAWASHRKELPVRKWLAGVLHRFGLKPRTFEVADNGAVLSVGSVPINGYLKTLGKKEYKHLPWEVLNFNQKAVAQILVGYIMGDGSVYNRYVACIGE